MAHLGKRKGSDINPRPSKALKAQLAGYAANAGIKTDLGFADAGTLPGPMNADSFDTLLRYHKQGMHPHHYANRTGMTPLEWAFTHPFGQSGNVRLPTDDPEATY